MEKLNRLTSTLNTLRKLSQDIIAKALPIMKDLESDDNDLVDEILEEIANIDKETANKILQEISLEFVSDAQKVHNEIEDFSEAVTLGEDGLAEGEDEYPFLLEVWCGDMYGESGVKGLQALVADLKDQLSNIDEDKILERTLARINALEDLENI